MAQTVLSSSDTAPWKALTEKLPGVLSVEFVTEGSAVREVHVLSDQSRSPKQIVRDVQSALLAQEGEKRGLAIRAQREDIFNAMHRI